VGSLFAVLGSCSASSHPFSSAMVAVLASPIFVPYLSRFLERVLGATMRSDVRELSDARVAIEGERVMAVRLRRRPTPVAAEREISIRVFQATDEWEEDIDGGEG